MPINDPRQNDAGTAASPALRDRVEAVLAQIRPAIQMDGGDLELVDVRDDGVVVVRLHGACVGCPSSHITLQAGIERQLRDHVPEVRGVEALN
jgi:Fe-S cluster biogenesis protein NfuA